MVETFPLEGGSINLVYWLQIVMSRIWDMLGSKAVVLTLMESLDIVYNNKRFVIEF